MDHDCKQAHVCYFYDGNSIRIDVAYSSIADFTISYTCRFSFLCATCTSVSRVKWQTSLASMLAVEWLVMRRVFVNQFRTLKTVLIYFTKHSMI